MLKRRIHDTLLLNCGFCRSALRPSVQFKRKQKGPGNWSNKTVPNQFLTLEDHISIQSKLAPARKPPIYIREVVSSKLGLHAD
jgi:hypothetical protein